jgi:hypothetical protein
MENRPHFHKFPFLMYSMMFSTIHATSSCHPSSKFLNFTFVKTSIAYILWSRHQWSPYGANTMFNKLKPTYLLTIEWSLDTKFSSWFFSTSKAILTFEITMRSKYPKCYKYIIGPYFFTSSSMEWWDNLFKYNNDPTMG